MSKSIREAIHNFMEQSARKSFSMEEIAAGLGLENSKDFKLLVQTIASMEREKSIELTKKGKIQLPMPLVLVEGTFRANERGFGFVTISQEEADIYIPQEATNYAMDGDTVAIDITKVATPGSDKGAEGKVVEIRHRAVSEVVGEFHLFSKEERQEYDLYGYVTPKDKKLNGVKVFVAAEGIRPVEGAIVKVSLSHYPEKGYAKSAEGVVVATLGHKNDPGMDILSIVVSHGIPTSFPEDVLAQANQVPDEIDPGAFPERRDLREQLIVTIDGADAKDLDDAVTVRKLANGHYFLGVHIADVSYYVTKNSPLDREAFERGTSVYLTDRVIPMIPQRLSNGICSLNPNVPRLTMSCEMEIDETGQVVAHEIFQSIIQTTERMTYTAVNQIIEEQDPEVRQRYAQLVPMFEDMAELHAILETMRQHRGAVSFDDSEAKIVVDEMGHPVEIVSRTRGVGERLIESFMLVANETVAAHYNHLHLPFIYRIHEDPKEEKLQRFFDFAAALGMVVKQTKGSITPKDLQQVLEEVEGRPEAAVISTVLLRSMQQAKYSESNYGHYGLAADDYTHFTSPIRRYPDLIVHRLIRSYSETQSEENQAAWAETLPGIALHSSQMERRAVDAEREVDSLKKAEYMADHIDEEFDGLIGSVVKFGFFVELPNTVEGLIHINELKDDYYHYLDTHLALVGERTGKTYKIGQKVRVRVVKADPETREIDFELVTAEEVTSIEVAKKGNRDQRRRRSEPSPKKETKKATKGKKIQVYADYFSNDTKETKKKLKKKGKKPFYKAVNGKKKGKNKK